jgi:hypothetical protein
LYLADGLAIDLGDVSVVICSLEPERPGSTCRVILRSGVSFTVDMEYSRSLIQGIEMARSSGLIVRPGATT